MNVLAHILSSWTGSLYSCRTSGQNKPQHTHFRIMSELTSRVSQGGYGESKSEFALYGSKNECTRTDTVFLSLSEVSEGALSLIKKKIPYSKLLRLYSKLLRHPIPNLGPIPNFDAIFKMADTGSWRQSLGQERLSLDQGRLSLEQGGAEVWNSSAQVWNRESYF